MGSVWRELWGGMPRFGDIDHHSDAHAGKAGGGEALLDYADPGYQSDGKLRYPIDTERHIRAAWSYINMPSNARRYGDDQVSGSKPT